MAKLQGPLVIDGIGAVAEPVAHIDIGAALAEVADDGGVAVAENAVVEMLGLQPLAAVDDDAFAIVALVIEDGGIFFDMAAAAVAAPSVGYAEGEGRGQEREEELVDAAAEDEADEVVAAVEMAEAVAVA